MRYSGNQWKRAPWPERFWAKVEVRGADECWNWIGSVNNKGYGRISDPTGRHVYVHRLSFQLSSGKDPGALLVCHRCDNPRCCNPVHLFLGSQADNMRDGAQKGRVGRKRGFRGQQGESNPTARLAANQVREIRIRKAEGESYTMLARAYGVSRGCIQGIVERTTWKHVV